MTRQHQDSPFIHNNLLLHVHELSPCDVDSHHNSSSFKPPPTRFSAWPLRCVHGITWSPYIGGKLSCTASRWDMSVGECTTWCSGRAAFEEKCETIVSHLRVVNLTRSCHWQGRVPSGDKLSHIVGLGFPLMWLTPKRREQLSCRESHAVSVESHQSRVRARVSRPFKTKKRRLLECNILTVVPNYFIVKIYHTSSPPCPLDPYLIQI